MTEYSYPSRDFKVWDYLVSHKQMVIRSLGPTEGSANLDFHFRGVEYFRAATVFRGLSVVAPTAEELDEAKRAMEPRKCEASMVWVLESGRHRHLVVADVLEVSETDYPMMVTALIHPTVRGGT